MQVRSKIWLEIDGEPIFGSGREGLFREIEKLGSINKAAKEINVSYKKALSYIQAMENRLGTVLVERKAGGKNGGGAALTEEARDFLRKFERLERGINKTVDRRFLRVFGDQSQETGTLG